MCGFHLAFQGNQPKWSLRWRVGASENEWLHVAKKSKNIYIECVERHADITSVIGAVVFGKLLQMTTKKTMSARGEPRTSKNKKSRDLNTTKCSNEYNFNYELRWTTNHHNSAVLRLERVPPSMCPSPNRPRYQTCVWMDPLCMNVWTQCWGARFISSNETPQQGAILSPWWAGPGVRLRVSHVRENGRMSCVCLAACVTGSMQDWVRTHAETEGNKIKKRWIQHLKRNKIEKRNNEVS